MLHLNKAYEIIQTPDFDKWYAAQDAAVKISIDARLNRVKVSGGFGDVKYLGDKLFEFKWKIGIRAYFVIKEKKFILLLNGGNKNDQKRDIQKARKLQKAYEI